LNGTLLIDPNTESLSRNLVSGQMYLQSKDESASSVSECATNLTINAYFPPATWLIYVRLDNDGVGWKENTSVTVSYVYYENVTTTSNATGTPTNLSEEVQKYNGSAYYKPDIDYNGIISTGLSVPRTKGIQAPYLAGPFTVCLKVDGPGAAVTSIIISQSYPIPLAQAFVPPTDANTISFRVGVPSGTVVRALEFGDDTRSAVVYDILGWILVNNGSDVPHLCSTGLSDASLDLTWMDNTGGVGSQGLMANLTSSSVLTDNMLVAKTSDGTQTTSRLLVDSNVTFSVRLKDSCAYAKRGDLMSLTTSKFGVCIESIILVKTALIPDAEPTAAPPAPPPITSSLEAQLSKTGSLTVINEHSVQPDVQLSVSSADELIRLDPFSGRYFLGSVTGSSSTATSCQTFVTIADTYTPGSWLVYLRLINNGLRWDQTTSISVGSVDASGTYAGVTHVKGDIDFNGVITSIPLPPAVNGAIRICLSLNGSAAGIASLVIADRYVFPVQKQPAPLSNSETMSFRVGVPSGTIVRALEYGDDSRASVVYDDAGWTPGNSSGGESYLCSTGASESAMDLTLIDSTGKLGGQGAVANLTTASPLIENMITTTLEGGIQVASRLLVDSNTTHAVRLINSNADDHQGDSLKLTTSTPGVCIKRIVLTATTLIPDAEPTSAPPAPPPIADGVEVQLSTVGSLTVISNATTKPSIGLSISAASESIRLDPFTGSFYLGAGAASLDSSELCQTFVTIAGTYAAGSWLVYLRLINHGLSWDQDTVIVVGSVNASGTYTGRTHGKRDIDFNGIITSIALPAAVDGAIKICLSINGTAAGIASLVIAETYSFPSRTRPYPPAGAVTIAFRTGVPAGTVVRSVADSDDTRAIINYDTPGWVLNTSNASVCSTGDAKIPLTVTLLDSTRGLGGNAVVGLLTTDSPLVEQMITTTESDGLATRSRLFAVSNTTYQVSLIEKCSDAYLGDSLAIQTGLAGVCLRSIALINTSNVPPLAITTTPATATTTTTTLPTLPPPVTAPSLPDSTDTLYIQRYSETPVVGDIPYAVVYSDAEWDEIAFQGVWPRRVGREAVVSFVLAASQDQTRRILAVGSFHRCLSIQMAGQSIKSEMSNGTRPQLVAVAHKITAGNAVLDFVVTRSAGCSDGNYFLQGFKLDSLL
jgi:hypothetical protein